MEVPDDILTEDYNEFLDPDTNYFNHFYDNMLSANQSEYISIDDYNKLCDENVNSFKILSYNIRSFSANSDTFLSSLTSENSFPEALVLTETWFYDNTCQEIDGYSSYHITRSGRSGGVSVYIKSRFDSEIIHNLSRCDETIEICAVKIKISGTILYLLAVYRPQQESVDNFVTSLNSILDDNQVRNKFSVVTGDLNINLLRDDEDTNNFFHNMYTYHYIPLVTKPTRFPYVSSHNPSLIDHFWINKLDLNYSCKIVLNDFTDHCPIFLSLKFENFVSNEKVKIRFRNVNPENKAKFENALRNFDWSQTQSQNVNLYFSKFMEVVNSIYNESFPIKTKMVSPKLLVKPWLTRNLKKLLSAKSKYFKLLQLSLISREENNSFKNKVKSIVSRCKRNFYHSYFQRNRNDMRKMWSMVRMLANLQSSGCTIKSLILNNVEMNCSLDIANAFNEYFTSIPSTLEAALPSSNTDPLFYTNCNQVSSLYLNPVSESECVAIVRSLKNTKGDLEVISVPLFKQYIHLLVPSLCKLINLSFKTGIFPDALKVAKIIPIYKKGDKSNPNNYRPIALLPFISKLFEKCLHSRLVIFFDNFNILSESQYGFRSGTSTADALQALVQRQYDSLNMRMYSLNVFVDFSKASDTVDRAILLRKLEKCGIRGTPLRLMSSYLSDRRQCVLIDGVTSSVRSIDRGVPQGSVLGPLLFLIYINDLPNCSQNFHSIMFADDTTLCFQNVNLSMLEAQCNAELSKFYEWSCANRLTVNADKTYLNIISNFIIDPQFQPNIFLNHTQIRREKVITFLGVKLDEKLKFNSHISYICNKVSKSIGILNRLKPFVSHCTLKNLYYSFVYSYISYCNLIWGSTFSCHLKPLIVIQKRVIRIMNNLGYRDHTNEFFYNDSILKVLDVYKFLAGNYMYENCRMPRFSTNHDYDTRFSSSATPIFQRLTLTQHSIDFMGPRIWNAIPDYIKDSPSLQVFKKKFKMYLIETYTSSD